MKNELTYHELNKPDYYGRLFWIITVANYGSFAYYGTELEAEVRRKAKANTEGSIAKKRISNPANKEDCNLVEKYNI